MTHILMIGGFLGAGKTTTIAQVARRLIDQGRRVGIVTNDQADDLVDTQFLRHEGFEVGEVAGACFCCKFDSLTETIDELADRTAPDVVLTEPVGSCTDLVATVIEPLRALHGDRFTIGPLAVLLKPEHGKKILSGRRRAGFSPKAQYIFLKQLEEADVIAVNKIDRLQMDEQEELLRLLRDRFPTKQHLLMSARTGAGIDQLVQWLEREVPPHRQLMDVDYQVYAEGEAELGWLNARAVMEGKSMSFDELALQLVDRLADRFNRAEMEPAHVKVLVAGETEESMANLVAADQPAELSYASHASGDRAELTVNARVAGDPEVMEVMVRDVLDTIAQEAGARVSLASMTRFRPSPPVPTHRAGNEE